MTTNKKWKRNCPNPNKNPKCNKICKYSTKGALYAAIKNNNLCNSCAKIGKLCTKEVRKKISETRIKLELAKGENNPMYGKKGKDNPNYGIIRSEETRKIMSKNNARYWLGKRGHWNGKKRPEMSGKNNPMYGRTGKSHPSYGKSAYDIWLEKYGKEEADKRQIESNRKNRLTLKKRIENRCGQISPNYNSVGCDIINWFNMYYGFNFRHAENGGEVCIDGYFPDGIDEKRKTIIEVDEPHHFNFDGTFKEKDIQRQNYLESLGYTFIRIKI